MKSQFDDKVSHLPINKKILVICDAPHHTECDQNYIFWHIAMVITWLWAWLVICVLLKAQYLLWLSCRNSTHDNLVGIQYNYKNFCPFDLHRSCVLWYLLYSKKYCSQSRQYSSQAHKRPPKRTKQPKWAATAHRSVVMASIVMATSTMTPNLGSVACYEFAAGAWCWVCIHHDWFPWLGRQSKTHRKIERGTKQWLTMLLWIGYNLFMAI